MKTQTEKHDFYFQGLWIPPRFFRHLQHGQMVGGKNPSRPNGLDLAVFIVVASYYDPAVGGCWASNRYIAEQFGCSEKAVQRAVSRLLKFKLLLWHGEHPKTKRILKTPWADQTNDPDRKCPGEPGQIAPPNTKNKEDSKTVGCKAADRKQRRKSMALFDHLTEQTKPTGTHEDDFANATKLHTALVQANKNVRRWSVRSWALDFAKLREDVGGLEITKVLLWYSGRIGNEYVPHAYSAKSFRAKFDQLKDAQQRWAARNPDVSVTGRAKDICADLQRWRWPGKCLDELPAAVQLSLDNYRVLWKYTNNLAKRDDLFLFCRAIQSNFLYPIAFVTRWFDHYGKWISQKDDFKGGLIPKFVFTLDHERFQEMGKNLATEYGSVKLWTKLMKEIQK